MRRETFTSTLWSSLDLAERKAIRVIKSCETVGQLMTAQKYITILINKFRDEYPISIFDVGGRLNWIFNEQLKEIGK